MAAARDQLGVRDRVPRVSPRRCCRAVAGRGFRGCPQGLFPGEKVTRLAGAGYRGQRHTFRVQRAALHPGDRVLLVDDWAEIGSQALAAKQLVEDCGATFAGLSLIVNQLPSDLQARLGPVAHLVRADQLGDPDADG